LNSEKEVISDSLKKSRGIDPEISGRVLDKTLENICEFTFLLTGQRPDPKKGKEV
jgi:hypothetical protein